MKSFIKNLGLFLGLFLVGAITPAIGGEILGTYYSVTSGGDFGLQTNTSTTASFDGTSDTAVSITAGASQSSPVFLIENNGGTDLWEIDHFGAITIDIGAAQLNFASTAAIRDVAGGAGSFQMLTYGSTVASGIDFGNVIAMSSTSSAQQVMRFAASSFAPTSGTADYQSILGNPTINQTGGSTGITTALYVNPTLTAAADWRDIRLAGGGTWSLAVEGAAPILLPVNAGTSPTEPFACAAGTVGAIQYVDDTNDTGGQATAEVCVCVGTDDDGAGSPNTFDWISIFDGAACPFF